MWIDSIEIILIHEAYFGNTRTSIVQKSIDVDPAEETIII